MDSPHDAPVFLEDEQWLSLAKENIQKGQDRFLAEFNALYREAKAMVQGLHSLVSEIQDSDPESLQRNADAYREEIESLKALSSRNKARMEKLFQTPVGILSPGIDGALKRPEVALQIVQLGNEQNHWKSGFGSLNSHYELAMAQASVLTQNCTLLLQPQRWPIRTATHFPTRPNTL